MTECGALSRLVMLRRGFRQAVELGEGGNLLGLLFINNDNYTGSNLGIKWWFS